MKNYFYIKISASTWQLYHLKRAYAKMRQCSFGHKFVPSRGYDIKTNPRNLPPDLKYYHRKNHVSNFWYIEVSNMTTEDWQTLTRQVEMICQSQLENTGMLQNV